MRKLILAVSLLAATQVLAQWREGGKPIPDTAWRKSNGKFGVMLMLSDHPDQFMADWAKPETPKLVTTEVAERGKPIVAFVFFVGCKETNDVCSSTVDFTVLRPDGSEYASEKNVELWKGKAAPPDDRIQLSVANLGIVIEPKDPAGKYLVRATAHDANADLSITVEQAFTVAK
jgi:hypothetical protein